ncbi:Na+/H+ antiporter subunit A [Nocardiopsis sp. LOL_012]|uniref:Na+/H+ antiporter subunit A n=1 Tax=Nocardiopsis sp. LOL_012 TaxID=3345409 RepID=UPI003A8C33DB
MTIALIAHFAAAALAPLLVRRWGRNAFLALALVPGATALWALSLVPSVARGGTFTVSTAWAPQFSLRLGLHMDALGLVMTLVATGVGALVLAYCARYFTDAEPGLGRFAGVFTAFAATMLGLVLADDLIQLFVYWELTTVFSYLLIGHSTEQKESRRAAMTALTVTTAGGLTMFVGIVVLGLSAGTFVLSELVASPPGGTAVNIALVLVMVGAMSKSALFPFSLWLPAAMRAPTPVSAYLHAAAMVKAGVYLVARLTPAFHDVPAWQWTAVVFGLATMVLGGWKALRQFDLKLVLAYGTISQLGFLVVLMGAGTRAAALAGIAALLAHSLFKSALFLVVGVIDHTTGTRDLRELSGLRTSSPTVLWISVAALASMAGLPPFLGFAAKELAFGAFTGGGTADTAVLVGLVAGSILTVAYSLRFLWGAFAVKEGVPETPVHPAGALFLSPAAVLAALGLLGGVCSGLMDPLLAVYADTVPLAPGAHATHLTLWHGFGAPLLLSALCLLLGYAMHAARHRVVWLSARTALVDPDRVYRRMLAGLDDLALQVTGRTQRGSLPVYLGTILVSVVAVSGWPIISGRLWELPAPPVRAMDTPVQLIPAAIIVLTCLSALFVRRRLFAVVLVGMTGYGCAVLFFLQGAPDLALTQFLVETVSILVFVLVLRRLPARFSTPALRGRRMWNLLIGVATGALVASMTYFTLAGRRDETVSGGFAHLAEEVGGENIVAVLLIDVRVWDTMGEISVLAAAAAGVASLMFVRRRSQPRVNRRTRPLSHTTPPPAPSGGGIDLGGLRTAPRSMHLRPVPGRKWLPSAGALPTERRSLIFEVVSRFLFPVVMVISVYLLLTGHSAVGGGFAGGLLAGLALTVRYLAGGRFELYAAAWLQPGALIGTGLALSTGTALAGPFLGEEILSGAALDLHIPLMGHLHLTSGLVFDLGVYLLVIGLVLDILRSLGARIDEQVERDATHAAGRDRGAETAEEVTP